MTSEQYILLYEKHLSGSCTPEEEALLMQYQDSFKIQDDHEVKLSDNDKQIKSTIFHRILRSISDRKKIFSLSWWWAAAAIVLFVVGIGAFFFNDTPGLQLVNNKPKPVKSTVIKPGTTTAVLTLANGANIVLDSAANGVVATTGNTSIKKLRNGLLSYADNKAADGKTINSLNTITIPRGGQYTITLPDGTNVWLNAESSLTYPVAFNGAKRNVTLKGEAYFEVAKNKEKPFIVNANGINVRVLGTHFNIKAYQTDDVIKTTLLEGSVRLSKNSVSALLVPGEQGIAAVSNDQITRKKVNVNQVIAWKSGYFIFRDEHIHDIMDQISRWYDVEVEYQGNMSNKTFGGIYSKNKDITELLKGLELTGLVHFKIEGRRIIVMT